MKQKGVQKILFGILTAVPFFLTNEINAFSCIGSPPEKRLNYGYAELGLGYSALAFARSGVYYDFAQTTCDESQLRLEAEVSVTYAKMVLEYAGGSSFAGLSIGPAYLYNFWPVIVGNQIGYVGGEVGIRILFTVLRFGVYYPTVKMPNDPPYPQILQVQIGLRM